jgi:hypothetical protein
MPSNDRRKAANISAKSQSAAAKPKKKSARARRKTNEKKCDLCFVIMPFGGWGDDYYETVYKPAVESANLVAHRADDLFRPSTIVNDIWAYTKKAKLLLADLTGRNPNVFYELGLAHALGKPAILIASSMEEVPFDLRALRVIIYDKNDPNWGTVLMEKVSSSIKEVLESPVAAVLPAFLEPDRSAAKPVLSDRELQLVEMKQQIEMLRHEIRSRVDDPETSIGRKRIAPEEAHERIVEFLDAGLPEERIVETVARFGAPRDWVRSRIKELQSLGPIRPKRKSSGRRPLKSKPPKPLTS